MPLRLVKVLPSKLRMAVVDGNLLAISNAVLCFVLLSYIRQG